MVDLATDLYAKFKQGPAILLLGQDYLRLETGVDPFLREVLRKYRSGTVQHPTYTDILDSDASAAVEASLAWMDERCRRLSVPEWLRGIAEYAWSGVYTSAIDSVWWSGFRTSWRDLQPLFEEKFRPVDPRNRFALHCTFLYGCVNRADEESRPPLTRFEYLKRKQVAVSLARRLPELITPLGILAIEGYAGDRDWLALDDLLPVLDTLDQGQVHIFSANDELRSHQDIQRMSENEKLVLHKESLAQTLGLGAQQGLLAFGGPDREAGVGGRIRLSDRDLVVPTDLWTQVSRSATIVDDSALVEPPRLSADARYREFRNFLSNPDGQPTWDSYARGFAFRRDFEERLERTVYSALGKKSLQDDPIILHGQTATGKTIALTGLARSVRGEGKYTVLFIERRLQRPIWSDLDRLCKWAEDSGSPACLLVWDGMLDLQEYRGLLRILTSRGRKVVLVGSAYRIRGGRRRDPRLVEAPAELTAEEISRLAVFLSEFHPALADILEMKGLPKDYTFLVALYRLLPPTRSAIRHGVSREMGYSEDIIADKAKRTQPQYQPATALEFALLKAGIVSNEQMLSSSASDVDGEQVTEVQDMTGLIMVPGRFGLNVPLELLLRALGRPNVSNFVELLEEADIFRWIEDSVGNIDIGPRNELEAKLVVQARLGGPATELQFSTRLLLEIRDGLAEFPENREVFFAHDLVRALGAQGQDPSYFAPYFKDISNSLRQLREERGVASPSLMLQEANLLREWAIRHSSALERGQQSPGQGDEQTETVHLEIVGAFDQAQSILNEALRLAGDDRRTRVIRAHLLGELGSARAARARHGLKRGETAAEVTRLFEAAREDLARARKANPGDYYPLDILAWATRDMLIAGVLGDQARAEALADVFHAFETLNVSDLDARQGERYQQRRLELADILGREDIAEEAFNALEAAGSGAGYYIRALRMSGLFDRNRQPQQKDLQKALHYLEENRGKLLTDARCLELQLDLWWLLRTGSRPFDDERVALALTDSLWRELLDIIGNLEATGESHRPVFLGFLRALALFHIGSVEQSIELFREVERESEEIRGRRRVIKAFLASTSEGEPRKYHGTVAWVSPDGWRGEIYAEELRRNVRFFPAEFGRPTISKSQSLGEFHIAFNFLGLTADPIGLYRR